MNWLETLGLKWVLGKVKANLGVTGMKRVGSAGMILGGLAAVLTGLESLLSHFTVGDLWTQSCTAAEAAAWSGQCPSNLMKCVAQIATGAAVFSPGWAGLAGHVTTADPVTPPISTPPSA